MAIPPVIKFKIHLVTGTVAEAEGHSVDFPQQAEKWVRVHKQIAESGARHVVATFAVDSVVWVESPEPEAAKAPLFDKAATKK